MPKATSVIEITPEGGDSDDEDEEEKKEEDDDGDLRVRYKSPIDNYSDLGKLQHKPLFISDLIQGLRSEDHKRFKIALRHAEGLIRG